MSISADTAIVGAFSEDEKATDSGSAYIFERSGGSWSETAKLTASDGEDGDSFGFSVSISDDIAIVGAYFEDEEGTNAGSAYIFERDGGSWSEVTKLTAPDGTNLDLFGASVSISGDTSIVGALLDDAPTTNSGSAYAYSCT